MNLFCSERSAALVFVSMFLLGACATLPEGVKETKPVAPATPPAPIVKSWPGPPVAEQRLVTDDYHGTPVVDAYRYFEDLKNPEVAAFMKAQSEYAQSVLGRIPGRANMLKRITQLSESGIDISNVQIAAEKIFYLKRGKGDATSKLYMREGFSGAERLLLDPQKGSAKRELFSIDYFRASPNGLHVAYGISLGGNEESVLRVLETAKGNDIGGAIIGARYGDAVSWSPDGKSFFYNKLPQVEGAELGYVNSIAYRHVLGKDAKHDEALFGRGIGDVKGLDEIDIPSIVVPPGSSVALAIVRHGDLKDLAMYSAPVAALNGAATPWKQIVERSHHVTDFEAHGNEIYLLTHKGAPRYKVLKMTAGRLDMAHAVTVIPQGDNVIKQIAVAADALYVKQLNGGLDVLQRLNFSHSVFAAGKLEYLRLPFDVAVRALITDPKKPGALLRLESWTEAPKFTLIEARSGDIKDTGLLPKPAVDFSEIDELRLFATAKDGVKIPVSMIYKKGTLLSGANPTLLSGYGAYGIALSPSFYAPRMAWLEQGGIFAICHARGGGEYGEDWHNAGRMANKKNTITDFIACGEFLIQKGFTSPRRLAATGGSAGGITVGNALTRRPDLFAAVVPRVGVLDMLRMEHTANGKPNIVEFGSTRTREGFKWLYDTSAYHQVKDKTAYPGVLITTGANDARVEPWNSLKFAARLQRATASASDKKPILLRIDYGTGHSSSNSRSSANEELADIYAFLLWQFGVPGFLPKDD